MKDRLMGFPISFENEEDMRLQFKDRNMMAKVNYKKYRALKMTAESRQDDLSLLSFDVEEDCEINLPISVSFS